MKFDLYSSIDVLRRTPAVLQDLLSGLGPHWTHANEGEGTWSPFDVMGHLVHGERVDWPSRLRLIMSDAGLPSFEAFDRNAQFEFAKTTTLTELLREFSERRRENLALLCSYSISETDLKRVAIHPSLGEVTLEQLLATWTAHDLAHILQITRTMARQYKHEVGPWAKNLSVMNS